MKKHTIFKSVQLVLFTLLAGGVIWRVFSDSQVYHQAATDPVMRLLCAALWAVLGMSFLFLFLDFFFFLNYRREYKEMDYALYNDPLSGIANRFSCDRLVEKYLDKPLPVDMGCIMVDISNIRQINQACGHLQGNLVISDFSAMLNASSEGLCFVGRNGGNKFLMLFDDTTETKMSLFLDRLQERVNTYNRNPANHAIEYRVGRAFHEDAEINEITKLIALSNSRIYASEEAADRG